MGGDSKWEGREADLCILLMRKGRKSEGAKVREKERENHLVNDMQLNRTSD